MCNFQANDIYRESTGHFGALVQVRFVAAKQSYWGLDDSNATKPP